MSIRHHTLSNGFQVITENMPGLKSASLGIWISAGGRHERLEQNGIAHFLEHMAFKGTKTKSALEIAEAIENVGGYINAYTSRETTAYFVRVLNDDVEMAANILSDILRNSVFEQRELDVERGVILQEIGQTLDTPDDIVFDWLQETAYPEQSLGRSILGPSENISRFSREDLSTFVNEHYSPDRMILSAAGGVDHDTLCKLAEKAFGDLKNHSYCINLDLQLFQVENLEGIKNSSKLILHWLLKAQVIEALISILPKSILLHWVVACHHGYFNRLEKSVGCAILFSHRREPFRIQA